MRTSILSNILHYLVSRVKKQELTTFLQQFFTSAQKLIKNNPQERFWKILSFILFTWIFIENTKINLDLKQSNTQQFIISCMPKEFVVEMGTKYPFGELGEVINEDTYTSVCKRLHHTSEQEYELIQHMIHFLKAARHQNLVNIKQVLQNQRQMQLYYEYVPFRLQGWLLDVNEELISQLQIQFLELAEYLCRSSIKFNFDPQCVGVSADMTLKYFLDQFVIDIQNGEQNLQILQKEIKEFFHNLKFFKKGVQTKVEISKQEQDESRNNRNQEEYLKKSVRMESISTNGSYSPQQDLSSLTKALSKIKVQNDKQKMTKGAMITAKLQNSKKKCQELLQRFKKVNLK